ncbi:Uncharacterised protein [Peptostreptococcus anaerobius]|uniref:Uncharacterized protein n=1 Tax=Peptostreptococcus anaerobius TaxID=1261 RepID=A0A379CI86_9FIRM|nr:hypothetical protein [Peptostreptococcus anaerobius]SFM86716.1 hypothetical protein SAMN05660467_00638 [Peptostreptococcus anaerobius]SUB62142.1 Uncharacterised protein [Peptostreptococcus anaerobius]
MKLLNNLDLTKNQLLNAVLQTLAQAPTDPISGQVYYNSADKRVYVWTGAVWLAMDAKDASPTAVSIVNAINDGTAMIEISKIKDLVTKLSAANIVATINDGTENINAERINGLANALDGANIVSKINDGTSKIDINKIDGLEEKLTPDKIVDSVIASDKTIPTNKITGLDIALAGKVTDQEAQNKANTALQQAKEFTTAEINKLINGAGEAYDTLKELGDLIQSNKGVAEALTTQIGKKTDKFVKVIGDGASKEFTVNHKLNTQDVIVAVRENTAPFDVVLVGTEYIDENNVKINFAKAPEQDKYKVIVIG